MVSVAEYLPNIYVTLGSVPSIAQQSGAGQGEAAKITLNPKIAVFVTCRIRRYKTNLIKYKMIKKISPAVTSL